MVEKLQKIGQYGAAGLFETPERSLFYRKALGLRRYYENCKLPEYHGKPLYPSGQIWMPNYMDCLAVDLGQLEQQAPETAEQIRTDFQRFRSSVPQEHTVAGDMYIHSMPHYERVLREGFLSYGTRIDQMQDPELRDGLRQLLEGIICYVNRCVAYLKEVHAEQRLIDALEKVPLYPAENIYEAVVAWNFVLYLDRCDNLGCVASGLYPYYHGEEITDLLENLFDNLDSNGGYSMALHTNYNALTVQCLEASKGKRRPMIELFVDENTPDAVWEKAFEVIRTCNGQPAFYNPTALLDGLRKRFPVIAEEDIKQFCGGGCTETMLAGLSNVGSLDAGMNLPQILEQTMQEKLTGAESFEAFYQAFLSNAEKAISCVTEEIANSQKNRAQWNPLPMRTLLIDDCIERGLDYNNGGARYQWSIINFAGMINVIDSLLVIQDLVFKSRKYSPQTFLNRLSESDAAFLQEARAHPVCFGIDDPDANALASRLSADLFSVLDGKRPYLGEGFLPASIQFMSQVMAGKAVGATPDGRTAGAPLCDSLAAIFGKDIQGPTALLNSVTSLNLERALGVPVLNFNINPDFRDEILKALILGYMKRGGMQLQITCMSAQMLQDAYERPEEYKNLVVRVGGYSEYFYRLSDELKRMVINRTIQNSV